MEDKLLDKQYNPKTVEDKWYKFWEENGFFKANPDSNKPRFCIVIPPPNITGKLHMGHALNNTLQDTIIRRKRMQGFDALWLPGTDHAGIATQAVVERELEKENIKRTDIGREKFVEKVWEWRRKYGDIILQQLRRLGASCDWSRLRFTFDDGLSRAVKKVFVELYREGYIYRGEYIINWCPHCHTAISDLEVEYSEESSSLWHIKYPIKDSKEFFVVATTRPETMLGDTAVAVHPDDKRYQKYHNSFAILPIVEKEIPVIADTFVDPEFGTGAVKVTPAHDPNDYLAGKRHSLPAVVVIDTGGFMNENALHFKGKDRFKAREEIVKELQAKGLIAKIENYTHSVGRCHRCETIIEPYISTQWFLKMSGLAKDAIKVVNEGRIRFFPENNIRIYNEWMENIKDWCISRQLWWGHRIPAWFCDDCGEITVSEDVPAKCSACRGANLRQESDVLDTWFSSQLWSFSTLGWPDETKDLKTYYPTSILVTAPDIIFFWVARMIMMGLKFMGDVPFREVFFTGMVRDKYGKKMTKSRGNVIDPLDIMESYGTDAMRFTLLLLSSPGADIPLDPKRMLGYKSFMNKIWNSTRFALMHLDETVLDTKYEINDLSLINRWIKARTNHVVREVNEALDGYRFHEAANAAYHFVWHQFCDWYIEAIKPILFSEEKENEKEKAVTKRVLYETLDAIIRLLHPMIPFITEEIWEKIPGSVNTVMLAAYPESDPEIENLVADEMDRLMEVIVKIRNMRSELSIPLGEKVEVHIHAPSDGDRSFLNNYQVEIRTLAKVKKIIFKDSTEPVENVAHSPVAGFDIMIPYKKYVNTEKEIERITREMAKIEKEITLNESKLNNESFLKKAPADVVEQVKGDYMELTEKYQKLENNLKTLKENGQ
jgi:valyl-tRNA synthetase